MDQPTEMLYACGLFGPKEPCIQVGAQVPHGKDSLGVILGLAAQTCLACGQYCRDHLL